MKQSEERYISLLTDFGFKRILEIAKFNKSESELVTLYDKWLYVLKNLSHLAERPQALREKVLFTRHEVVAYMLDMLKYTSDRNLSDVRIFEPSCGNGK